MAREHFDKFSSVLAQAANTNAAATATAAAPGLGFRYLVHGFTLSANGVIAAAVEASLTGGFTDVAGNAVTITVELPAAATAAIHVNFVRPLLCAPNVAAVLTLPALGASIKGTATLYGTKIPA